MKGMSVLGPGLGVALTRSHQSPCFSELLQICRPSFGPDRAGGENQSNHPLVLPFNLILPNGRPAGTVSNQHNLSKALLFSEIDPGGNVPDFLAGYAPIAAASNALASSPCQHVSQVVHAR